MAFAARVPSLAGPVVDPPSARFAAWCAAVRRGDRRAYEALFRGVYPSLVRYAASLVRDDAAAADIVQDVFLRVWERRADLDPDRSLQALLFRMARNLAFNHRRDAAGRRAHLEIVGRDVAESLAARPARPDEHADGQCLEARLRRYVEALPPRQREALMLSRFEGLSHDEIAAVMGVSPRTVNNHLVKALQMLRERLQPQESIGSKS